MASLMRLLNRLLPFATPGTPLLQDLVHLGVICGLLYFAPQIQERLQQRQQLEQNELPDPLPRFGQGPVQEEAGHAGDHGDFDLAGGEQDGVQDVNENNFHEQQQDEVPDFRHDVALEAGPAGDREIVPPQRNVGAKKAKSLARRDQRRAYHEFQRNQGEAQRARDAEGAAERIAQQAAERERRRAAEAKLDEKKANEREKRREMERKERELEMSRREQALDLVRQGLDDRRMSNVFEVTRQVGGDADDVWLEKILNASGLLGKQADGALTMVTSTGWVVKVNREDMLQAYARVADTEQTDEDGIISYQALGKALESVIKEHSADSG